MIAISISFLVMLLVVASFVTGMAALSLVFTVNLACVIRSGLNFGHSKLGPCYASSKPLSNICDVWTGLPSCCELHNPKHGVTHTTDSLPLQLNDWNNTRAVHTYCEGNSATDFRANLSHVGSYYMSVVDSVSPLLGLILRAYAFGSSLP